jgi:hypothetical protein
VSAAAFDPKASTRNDWQTLPGLEAVSLLSLGPIGTYTTHALSLSGRTATTLRRALTWKEIQASAGAYTGANQKFIIPDQVAAASLPSGVIPKAGDLIQDSAGVNHTVLENVVGKHGNTHACVTIALAVVNNLGVTGTLTRPDNTQDAAGRMALTSYSTVGTSLCRVEPEQSQSGDVLGRRTTAKRFTAFLETPLSVQARDQFTAGGVTYTVLGFRNPARLDQLQSLDLEQVL